MRVQHGGNQRSDDGDMVREDPTRTTWTFVTNHARVLATIARDPGIRLRDIAIVCELTERAVQAIVADLEQAGYLTHVRTGRRNRYHITTDTTLRHPAEAGLSVADLLDMLAPARPGSTSSGVSGAHPAGEEGASASQRVPDSQRSSGRERPPLRQQSRDTERHPSSMPADSSTRPLR